jgi:hypothetical protein
MAFKDGISKCYKSNQVSEMNYSSEKCYKHRILCSYYEFMSVFQKVKTSD